MKKGILLLLLALSSLEGWAQGVTIQAAALSAAFNGGQIRIVTDTIFFPVAQLPYRPWGLNYRFYSLSTESFVGKGILIEKGPDASRYIEFRGAFINSEVAAINNRSDMRVLFRDTIVVNDGFYAHTRISSSSQTLATIVNEGTGSLHLGGEGYISSACGKVIQNGAGVINMDGLVIRRSWAGAGNYFLNGTNDTIVPNDRKTLATLSGNGTNLLGCRFTAGNDIKLAAGKTVDLQRYITPQTTLIEVIEPVLLAPNSLSSSSEPYSFTVNWKAGMAGVERYEVSVYLSGNSKALVTDTVEGTSWRFHWAAPSTNYDFKVAALGDGFPRSALATLAVSTTVASTAVEPTAAGTTWSEAFEGLDKNSEVLIPADRTLTVDEDNVEVKALRIVIPPSGEAAELNLSKGLVIGEALCVELTIGAAEDGEWLYRSFPFDVHLTTGVRRVAADGKESYCVLNTDYAASTYDGARRAKEGFTSDNNKVWTDVQAADNYLRKGRGYIFAIAGAGTYRIYAAESSLGEVSSVGVKSVALKAIASETGTEMDAGWNMMGLPILSRFYYANSDDATLPKFLYRNVGGKYEAIRTDKQTFVMKPYESYLAQAPQTVGWPISYGTSQVKMSRGMPAQKDLSAQVLSLRLSKEGKTIDQTAVAFDEQASVRYVINEDAAKLFSGRESGLWTERSGEMFAHNSLPYLGNGVGMALKVRVAQAGTYKLNRLDSNGGCSQVLVGRSGSLDSPVDLLQSDYTMECATGETQTLELRFTQSPTSIAATESGAIVVYSDQDWLVVKGEHQGAEVFAIGGEKVANMCGGEERVQLKSGGVYLVQIVVDGEMRVLKHQH